MTEAARAVLAWVIDRYPTVQRVVSRAAAANLGSQRVMEKCGLRFERTVLSRWAKCPEPVEQREYGMSRDDLIRDDLTAGSP